MTRPDDSSLTPAQHAAVRAAAKRALQAADAFGQLPTPVPAIMAAAGITELAEPILDPAYLAAQRGQAGDRLKRALGKVQGLFDAAGRLVVIDRSLPAVRQTFIRLHETGHGVLPWQSQLYAVIEDCQASLDPAVAELFEREANVFAAEALFQLDNFAYEAAQCAFGIRTPLALSSRYGASIYATMRQYVLKHHLPCALLVLDPPAADPANGGQASLRRSVASASFRDRFGEPAWPERLGPADPLGRLLPPPGRRMVEDGELVLTDRAGAPCPLLGESFTQTHQLFILLRPQPRQRRGRRPPAARLTLVPQATA